jgi:hypothetical protein
MNRRSAFLPAALTCTGCRIGVTSFSTASSALEELSNFCVALALTPAVMAQAREPSSE